MYIPYRLAYFQSLVSHQSARREDEAVRRDCGQSRDFLEILSHTYQLGRQLEIPHLDLTPWGVLHEGVDLYAAVAQPIDAALRTLARECPALEREITQFLAVESLWR